MHRLLIAVSLALLLASAGAAVAESAQSHATAAKKAERAHNWSKALQEWQEAYKLDLNADYLVGMGDAYARMGDKDNARRQYQAYLADPLAVNPDKVKGKIAALDAPSLDLPGGAPGLPGLPDTAPAGGTGLALPGMPDAPAVAEASTRKRGRKGKKGDTAPGLDLPGADLSSLGLPDAPATAAKGGALELPAANPQAKTETRVAAADPMALPAASNPTGLQLPDSVPADTGKGRKGKKGRKGDAMASLDLPAAPGLPGLPGDAPALPGLPLATGPAAPPAKLAAGTPPPAATPASTAQPRTPPKEVTVAVAAPPSSRTKPPPAAFVASPAERTATSSSKSNVLAYATAGVAIVALGSGGLFFSQSSSDHSALTGTQVRSAADNQKSLDDEKTHKTLALAGFAAGLALAGVSAALFAF